jgi:hypothetical protein
VSTVLTSKEGFIFGITFGTREKIKRGLEDIIIKDFGEYSIFSFQLILQFSR